MILLMLLSDGFTGGNLGYADIVIGNDETKWIAHLNMDLLGLMRKENNPLIKSISNEDENMPY